MKPNVRLLAATLLVLAGASACTKKSSSNDAGPSEHGTLSEAAALAARQACEFKAGALPQATLAVDQPLGSGIPIDHVILLMQENHSFDTYFSLLPGVTAASPTATNPDADGGIVQRFHFPDYCHADTNHSWAGSHQEYDNGLLDGFVLANDPDGERAMGYYTADDLPYYYGLAQAFAISDSHHCSLLGPTSPNRMFALAATSWGNTSSGALAPVDPSGNPYPNLMLAMNQANISWKVYHNSGGAPPDEALFVQTWLENTSHFVSFTDFLNDAAAGNLPSVSIVDPYTEDGTGDSQDEHPPSDPQLGQAWVSSVVSALMSSPNWGSMALFFSYDEHGGFYDSVPPPAACPPDSFPAILGPGDPDAGFDQLGFRVPLIVVSPYARRGYVSHTVTDHTSLMRFIEARFNLPALTARDANADPLFDMFDFSKPDLTVPSLPEAVIDPTQLALCKQQFPDDGGSGL